MGLTDSLLDWSSVSGMGTMVLTPEVSTSLVPAGGAADQAVQTRNPALPPLALKASWDFVIAEELSLLVVGCGWSSGRSSGRSYSPQLFHYFCASCMGHFHSDSVLL